MVKIFTQGKRMSIGDWFLTKLFTILPFLLVEVYAIKKDLAGKIKHPKLSLYINQQDSKSISHTSSFLTNK